MKKLFPKTNMFEEAKRQSEGKIFILEILIFVGVFLVTGIISSLPSLVYSMSVIMKKPEVLDLINQFTSGAITQEEYTAEFTRLSTDKFSTVLALFCTGITTILVIVFCRFIEKRKISTMGFRKKGAALEYLVGALVGIVMYTFAVGLAYAAGALTFDGVVSNIQWGFIALCFAGFLIQGMSEEVLCRGYFMVSLSRRSHIIAAVVISSVAFGCLHLANPGVSALAIINITLFGIFEGVYILKRGNIWGVCAIHSLWNFVQGNFYGISVSGAYDLDSVVKFSNVPSKDLFNGGQFGLEASIPVSVVLVIAIIATALTKTNANELFDEANAPMIESAVEESDVEITEPVVEDQ